MKMSSGVPQSGPIVAIDIARVFAILFMIQGHTIHVLLAPQYQQGSFFDWWLFFRGLTAPVFLSLAGASFFVASMRVGTNAGPRKPGSSFRRIRRFASFICLGYLMHMPARSFSDLRFVDSAAFETWYQVDVLQCIGVTLIALQLLTLVAKTPQRYAMACLTLGSLIILATPLTWSFDWHQFLPGFASAYMNGNSGSLFPLFPWSGYVFIGDSLGYLYAARPTGTTIRLLALVAIVALVAGNFLQRFSWTSYGSADYWKTSPTLFLIRWGSVCLLLMVITAVVRLVPMRSLPSAKMLASESLIAYVVHIAILYGSSWNTGLRQVIGGSLDPAQTGGFIVVMIVVSCLLAMGWHLSKRKLPSLRQAAADALLRRILRPDAAPAGD
jgi:uncharacterized membrane protein